MIKWESQFELGDALTAEQLDFFREHGVILFRNFLSPELVQLYISEVSRIEQMWLDEKREKVNGIPLKFGKDDKGKMTIQRLCFTSLYSDSLHQLIHHPIFQIWVLYIGILLFVFLKVFHRFLQVYIGFLKGFYKVFYRFLSGFL
jgi:hypothetical protein